MNIGNYRQLSLAGARDEAKRLSARVALGYDVAGEKQQRKGEAVAKIEAEKTLTPSPNWLMNTLRE